jgi:hypothetical protein
VENWARTAADPAFRAEKEKPSQGQFLTDLFGSSGSRGVLGGTGGQGRPPLSLDQRALAAACPPRRRRQSDRGGSPSPGSRGPGPPGRRHRLAWSCPPLRTQSRALTSRTVPPWAQARRCLEGRRAKEGCHHAKTPRRKGDRFRRKAENQSWGSGLVLTGHQADPPGSFHQHQDQPASLTPSGKQTGRLTPMPGNGLASGRCCGCSTRPQLRGAWRSVLRGCRMSRRPAEKRSADSSVRCSSRRSIRPTSQVRRPSPCRPGGSPRFPQVR